LSQKSGPFAPPALPGINAPTTLSDSRLGISGNLADVYIFRFDRDSLIFCARSKKSTGPKWIGPEPIPIQATGHSSIADDPPPFKWSDLKYAFDIKKDS